MEHKEDKFQLANTVSEEKPTADVPWVLAIDKQGQGDPPIARQQLEQLDVLRVGEEREDSVHSLVMSELSKLQPDGAPMGLIARMLPLTNWKISRKLSNKFTIEFAHGEPGDPG